MQTRVLIVEDDNFKANDLCVLIGNANIMTVVGSVRDAVVRVFDEKFDLILLDMSLPTFRSDLSSAGGTSQAQGGVEVLRAIRSKGAETPVILVSQYPDLEMDGKFLSLISSPPILSERYGINVVGAVLYDFQDRAWADQLEKVLSEL